jgi:hypothetical protein
MGERAWCSSPVALVQQPNSDDVPPIVPTPPIGLVPAGDISEADEVIIEVEPPEHGLLEKMGPGMVTIGLRPPLGVRPDGTAPASTIVGIVTGWDIIPPGDVPTREVPGGDVVTMGGVAVTNGLKPPLAVKPDGIAPASTTGPVNVVPATGGTVMIGLRPPPDARFDGTEPALMGESA